MRKLLLFTVVLFVSNFAFSQIVLSDTLTIDNQYANTDTIGMPVEEYVYFRVHSNNDASISCILEVVDIDIPDGTFFEICVEGGTCVTDIDDIMQVGGEFPVEDSLVIHFMYLAFGAEGDAFIKLKVSNRNNPDDTATISYDTEKYVSLNELSEEFSVEIYPNPVEDILFISCSDVKQDFMIIYDVNGKIIETKSIKANYKNIELNVSDYEQGIYFIKIGNRTTKFVKK